MFGRELHKKGAGATPKTFWAALGRKSGVAPAQSGYFFCVIFFFLVSFISSFFLDLCAYQAEEDVEDEAEVGNSYLLQLLRQNSRRGHRGKSLVGLERPRSHFWARNRVQKWGRSSPTRCHSAAILPILSCATSSCLDICSLARVNARVTDKVICAFHAPVTFSRCRKRWKPFDIAEASTIKEASKREKVRKNFAPLTCKKL